jgi:hypothetical protein
MRIFQKTHFWKDKRTFLDAEGNIAKLNERGYAEDGSVSLRIGDEEGVKAAFKMTVDEVRALRDVLDGFIRQNDRRMMKLFKDVRDRRSGHEKRDQDDENHDSQSNYERPSNYDRQPSRDYSSQSSSGYSGQPEGYGSREQYSDRREEPRVESLEVEPAQFSIFDTEDKKKEEPKVKYYY